MKDIYTCVHPHTTHTCMLRGESILRSKSIDQK